MQSKLLKQKYKTALRLEEMVSLKPEDKYSKKNREVKVAITNNLISAVSRHISYNRVSLMLTITFGRNERNSFKSKSYRNIVKRAKEQYDSLMFFLYKTRKTKRVKDDIRYFCVIELQSDGNLHAHIYISFGTLDDLFRFIDFIHDFKKRHNAIFKSDGKTILPIGRTHLGVSNTHKKEFEHKYILKPVKSKSDPNRVENYMVGVEHRNFESGNWTVLEFYNKEMLMEMHREDITRYICKTIEKSNDTIEEGA